MGRFPNPADWQQGQAGNEQERGVYGQREGGKEQGK